MLKNLYDIHSPHRVDKQLFSGYVEITEKIDGSQVKFGKINGELILESKENVIDLNNPEKLFIKAVEVVKNIPLLPDNLIFFCEYLKSPRHQTASYDHVPHNNLLLFGVYDPNGKYWVKEHATLKSFAKLIDVDIVPLLFSGIMPQDMDLDKFIERESYLGKAQIEGVVVKSLDPLCSFKHVCKQFKELNHRAAKKGKEKNKWQFFQEGFRTEARWNKAIQHLKEKGALQYQNSDIQLLIKEIQNDILKEEKDTIINKLWEEYAIGLLKRSVAGFPEYYKEYLSKGM
jgi:hypothetical protein